MRTELLPAFEMSRQARRLGRRASASAGRACCSAIHRRSATSRSTLSTVASCMDDLGIQVVFVTSERLYDHQRETTSNELSAARWPTATAAATPASSRTNARRGHAHHGRRHRGGDRGRTGQVLPPGQCRRDRRHAPGHARLSLHPLPHRRRAVLDDRRCTCGRGLPMLKEIQGRTTDFVVAADGTVMHGLALIYVLRDLPGLQSFKVVQHDLQRTTVMLVPGPVHWRR
jgi:phenylacetate-CoA ligase